MGLAACRWRSDERHFRNYGGQVFAVTQGKAHAIAFELQIIAEAASSQAATASVAPIAAAVPSCAPVNSRDQHQQQQGKQQQASYRCR